VVSLNNTTNKALIKGEVNFQEAKANQQLLAGTLNLIANTENSSCPYQIFIKQSPMAIAMLDVNMCYIAHSEKWISNYNIESKCVIGKSHYEVFPEIDDNLKKDHQVCLNGKTIKKDQDCFSRADGTVQWLKRELRPWFNQNNEIGGIIMFTEDVTEKKLIEDKLAISEAKFRGNFEYAATGMIILDLNGKCRKINPKLVEILGYSVTEFKNLCLQGISHPDDVNIIQDIIPKLLGGLEHYSNIEKRYYHKNGAVIYTISSIALVKDSRGMPVHFLVQINDITARVRAEKQIELAYAEIQAIFKASSKVIIVATDKSGVITEFNQGAENLLGYQKEEVVLKEFLTKFHCKQELLDKGEELSKIENKKIRDFDIFTEIANKEHTITQDWTYIHKNGSCFPVQLTLDSIRDKANNVVGYLGVAIDISEIKEDEKAIKELLDVTTAQNERLLNFAHIVSHNLRSHSGNFNMLLELFVEENKEFKNNEIIEMLYSASQNLTNTVAHLTEVVQMNTKVSNNLVAVNLNNALCNVIENVSALILDSGIEVKNQIDANVNILCIPAYLDSILLNFLTNAIKYRSHDTISHVTFGITIENNFLVLRIADNGLGIDLEKHGKQLFGMYKTFHHIEDSRGLGLFLVKNQIESMGGKVAVESEVNKGTIFKIYFKHEKKG